MRLPEPPHIKKITPKPPRPYVMMFCVIIMAVFMGVATPLRGNSQPQITFQRFAETMLKTHDVQEVKAYKSGDLLVAEVYLKPGSIAKPEFSDARKEKSDFLGGDNSSPQYVFTTATYDGLVKQIDNAETSFSYAGADKIAISIEQGHESLLSNWLVQCVIMIFLLAIPILCGYWGHKEGKNRVIGPTVGLLFGILFGPFGLLIVYLTEKKPAQTGGGIRV